MGTKTPTNAQLSNEISDNKFRKLGKQMRK